MHHQPGVQMKRKVIRMRGHWDPDGTTMTTAIKHVAEHAGIKAKVKSFPWWLVSAMSPFNTTLPEMREMRYLWEQTIEMDNSKLIAFLGHEPQTPLPRPCVLH
jgi:nucleoside-diphosphate-sugar epimerase